MTVSLSLRYAEWETMGPTGWLQPAFSIFGAIASRLFLVGNLQKASRELAAQVEIARNLGVPVLMGEQDELPVSGAAVINALFGVGLAREVTGAPGQWTDRINRWREGRVRCVVSVDLPSGIDADTGAVMGRAVRADRTVTFGWEKLGTALYPGRDYGGEVTIAEIGFPREAIGILHRPGFGLWNRGLRADSAQKSLFQQGNLWTDSDCSRFQAHVRGCLFERPGRLSDGGQPGKNSDGSGEPPGTAAAASRSNFGYLYPKPADRRQGRIPADDQCPVPVGGCGDHGSGSGF